MKSMIIVSALIAAVCVLGTTGASNAKGKKEAAPERKSLCMTDLGGPVCGTRGGMKFTYANSCYAMQDGAKVSRASACGGAKKKKM